MKAERSNKETIRIGNQVIVTEESLFTFLPPGKKSTSSCRVFSNGIVHTSSAELISSHSIYVGKLIVIVDVPEIEE